MYDGLGKIFPFTGTVKSKDYENVYLISGDLEGSGLDGDSQIVTFARNRLDYSGSTLSVNSLAAEFTRWPLGAGTDFNVTMTDDGASESQECVKADIAQSAAQVVNGAHLLGLTIDQAREELGAPDEDEFVDPSKEQLALGVEKWSNQFTVGEYTVLLDFNIQSREVIEFFINSKDGATRDWKALLPISGLSEDSSAYTIKPVEARSKAGYYTGVIASE